jgi:two-component system, OmpR family, response regulator
MSKRKVLIVDDDEDLARTTKTLLENAGPYDVCVENNPKSALRTAQEFRPDIILLDVIMPDMDGGEVAEVIREDARLKKTPILFLTSIVGKGEAAAHEGLIGNEEVLAKPATTEELLEAIEKLLAQRE